MKKKILVLEDHKDVGKLYIKLLKTNNYEPVLAEDGLEGLDKLQSFEPDLILMDVSMPKMSGVGFFQNICGSDGRPKYPVLVVTGRMDLEMTFKGLPVEGVILKPFDREYLLKAIEDIFKKQALPIEAVIR